MCVSFYGTLKYSLRKWLFEGCMCCALYAPGQVSHDCVNWSDEDINQTIYDFFAELSMESCLNAVNAGGY